MIDAMKTIAQFPWSALIGMAIGAVILVGSMIHGYRSAPRSQPGRQDVPSMQVVQNNINSSQNTQSVNVTHHNYFSGPKLPTRPNAPFQLASGAKLLFLSPTNGQVISRALEVHAVIEGLRSEDDLWVFVYAPSIKRYYPTEVLVREPELRTSLVVGAKIDKGSHFQLGLFVTNKEGSAYMRQFKEEELFDLPPGHQTVINVRREVL